MFREVTMVDITEVLRLWVAGTPKKRIAAQFGLDPKTVRRYVAVARRPACSRAAKSPTSSSATSCSRSILGAVGRGATPGPPCEAQRAGGRPVAARRRPPEQDPQAARPPGRGDSVSDAASFRRARLRFGQTAATLPVADGEPGQELEVDTGWVGWLTPSLLGRKRFRAWIFTAVRSRYRFVYPAFEETTARAIEACGPPGPFSAGSSRSSSLITRQGDHHDGRPAEPAHQ